MQQQNQPDNATTLSTGGIVALSVFGFIFLAIVVLSIVFGVRRGWRGGGFGRRRFWGGRRRPGVVVRL